MSEVGVCTVGFYVQADAAQMKKAVAATAPSKGPRNNNSPTKGLLGNSGQLSLLTIAEVFLIKAR